MKLLSAIMLISTIIISQMAIAQNNGPNILLKAKKIDYNTERFFLASDSLFINSNSAKYFIEEKGLNSIRDCNSVPDSCFIIIFQNYSELLFNYNPDEIKLIINTLKKIPKPNE